ncbi:hypothetical protein GCM10009687_73390 [Asanoa iriomotensis]
MTAEVSDSAKTATGSRSTAGSRSMSTTRPGSATRTAIKPSAAAPEPTGDSTLAADKAAAASEIKLVNADESVT